MCLQLATPTESKKLSEAMGEDDTERERATGGKEGHISLLLHPRLSGRAHEVDAS